MGVEIHGWIEIRKVEIDDFLDEVIWFNVVEVDVLLHRNTNAFGCLFGVRNPSHFVPIAPDRGLPADASNGVRNAGSDWCHSHTWITWRELKQVDWQESVVDAFVRCYQKNETGEWIVTGGYIPDNTIDHTEGRCWEDNGCLYKIERITRAEAVKDTFDLVFDLMERLAQSFGEDYVRLVVWFDS